MTQLLGWLGLSAALLLFSLNSVWLFPFTVWAVFGAAYFGLSFFANVTFRRFDIADHDRRVARWSGCRQPSVDVLLPNCGEDLVVLDNAFAHVAALSHKGRLAVYCLDDAGRPEVEALAAAYGFRYLSRPDKGVFKKAGNLRYAYLRTDGDFIAIFDADFCPRPDFLSELLPYALEDESVGIVQSPQYFEVRSDKGWLENGAAAVQEFFYRLVMPGRDCRASPICVGTNAVYRRSALVETDGGALVENSEDVHTGFDLLCKGYRTKYVPLVLATGLCPGTLRPFFNQQHRWCTGSMSLLFSHKFWHEPIGLRARSTFLAGMTYFVYTALGVVIAPLPAVILVCFFPDQVRWWNYLLLVPTVVQTFVVLPLWHRAPYGLAAMRAKLIYSWAHLFALCDRITGRSLGWSPSGGAGRPTRRFGLAVTLLVSWPLVTFGAIVAGSAAHMDSPMDINYWPTLFFGAVYCVTSLAVLQPLPRMRYISRLRDTRNRRRGAHPAGVTAPSRFREASSTHPA